MKLVTKSIDPNGSASLESLPEAESDQTLVLCFGSSGLFDRPAILSDLARRYPHASLLGCSTSGEIFGNDVRDGSVSIAVADFEKTRLATAHAAIESIQDSFGAGVALAQQLVRDDLRGVLVLSDGLHVNGSELVRGLNQGLPDTVIVTGGLAGDDAVFKRTWVLHQGSPVERTVCAVGLYGDAVSIGHGSRGGWDKFGPERTVTKAVGNVLYELDGRPALSLYERYLGEKARDLPGSALLFPLSLRSHDESEEWVTRTVLAVSKAEQSMTFAGTIPEGFQAQMMKANFDRLIQAAGLAAGAAALAQPTADDTLSIAISCVGRRLILGERTEQELDATLSALPKRTQQVGFYSYGEISPFAQGFSCGLHNQTMTMTTICES